MNSTGNLRSRPGLGLGNILVGAEERALVEQVLQSRSLNRYYATDPAHPPKMVATLEREFGAITGARFVLAVTSGSGALECALGALGLGPGDEVILPAWSWVACWTSIVHLGATPVLAEIDETLCLDPAEIDRLVTPRTKAVMVIHYQGVASRMDAILERARHHGLKVLEDCAQSPGVSFGGRRVGTLGDIGIYSLQHNKPVCSGEGGLLVTDDPVLYERAVRMHDIGQYRAPHAAQTPARVPSFSGCQFRMSELTGAVALAQIRRLDRMIAHCRGLHERVAAVIAVLPGLRLRELPDPAGIFGYELYYFAPSREIARTFTERLTQANVNCGRRTGTYPHYTYEYCHTGNDHSGRLPAFAQLGEWPAAGYRAMDFPRTEDLSHRFVSIPLGVAYSADDADYIGATIKRISNEIVG